MGVGVGGSVLPIVSTKPVNIVRDSDHTQSLNGISFRYWRITMAYGANLEGFRGKEYCM